MLCNKLYIAPKMGVEENEYGREMPYFGIPIPYKFNYQPTYGKANHSNEGIIIDSTFEAFVDKKRYLGKIKANDLVYLIDGETQNIDELVMSDEYDKYCSHANYRVKYVLPQNIKLHIVFEKITNGKGGNRND